jgi:hypothetical protein
MPITSGQLTIGQTAQQIDGTDNQPYRLHLNNNSNTTALFVGGDSSVSTTTGLKLAANDSMDLTISPYDTIWIVSSSNNHDVSWLKQVY